jgi:hypothetical protein
MTRFNTPLAPTPIRKAVYRHLVERYGRDSYRARFYAKYMDSWYPCDWTTQELEEELARPGNEWSARMQEAFLSEYLGRENN